MRTIIYDLNENDLSKFYFDSEDVLIDSNRCKNSCIGCFSCWLKHPTKCIYNDEFSNIVDSLKKSKEFIIISRIRYGCYSNSIKRVLERCIGYVMPHFTLRGGEIHHKDRFNDRFKLKVYLYPNYQFRINILQQLVAQLQART
jgi:hypothetical protein